MIVIDSSALMAILLREAEGPRCADVIASHDKVLISAATVAEAMIVALGRSIAGEMERFLAELALEVAPVDAQAAQSTWRAYRRWGRGHHPARLNFGDCFAYALAMERGWPLLYAGEDFAKTDVLAA